jgi:hypothetical protein
VRSFFIYLISFASCSSLFSQTERDNCFKNLYIEKPFLKSDSTALIKNKITKVKLYEMIVEDTIPFKTFLGEWKVTIENEKIKGIEWKGSDIKIRNSYVIYGQCLSYTKRIINKRTVVDSYNEAACGFTITHSFDKFGRIYQSKVRRS